MNLDNVVSVRVSLLLRSNNNILTTATSSIFNHFGVAYAPSNVAPALDLGAVFNPTGATLDRRMRRLYGSTITVRNRVN